MQILKEIAKLLSLENIVNLQYRSENLFLFLTETFFFFVVSFMTNIQ